MWIAKDDSGKVYKLTPTSPFLIGRNSGDLILKNDASISRNHAKVTLLETSNQCVVTDSKSKYGTYLLDSNSSVVERITDNYIIKPNDRIRFGLQNSILTFSLENFVVLTSALTAEDKEALDVLIPSLGGEIVRKWSNNCTHLTLSSSKLTAKLACALAAGIPVVKLDFWKALKNARETGNEPPNPRDFCPALEDSMLHSHNSLLPVESRKTIFKDILFVHFRQNQLEVYKTMIELAGGRAVFYGSKSFDKKLLSDEKTMLVLFDEEDSQAEPYKVPSVSSIQGFLKKYNRRMIPDCEIPLAILYSSVEKHCNPSFSYDSLLKSTREEKKMVLGETLAMDTQDLVSSGRRTEKFIPESMVVPESEPFLEAESQKKEENRNKNVDDRENEPKTAEIDANVKKETPEEDFVPKNTKKRPSEAGDDGVQNKKIKIEQSPRDTEKIETSDGKKRRNVEDIEEIRSKEVKIGRFGREGEKNGVCRRKNDDSDDDYCREEENAVVNEAEKLKREEEKLKAVREVVLFSQSKSKKTEESGENSGKTRKVQENGKKTGEKSGKTSKTEETQPKIEDWGDLEDEKELPEELWTKCSGKNSTTGGSRRHGRSSLKNKSDNEDNKDWMNNLDGEFCGISLRDLAEEQIFRREIFTGEFFGKSFNKVPVQVPRRISMARVK